MDSTSVGLVGDIRTALIWGQPKGKKGLKGRLDLNGAVGGAGVPLRLPTPGP